MRAAIHLLILAFLSAASIAQTTDSTTTSSTTTQLASALLTQMLTAGGWSPATLPSDVITQATVSMAGPKGPAKTRTVVFKARGRAQFRWDYGLPGQAAVSDLAAGLARAGNGMGLSQPPQPWQLPFLSRLQDFADPVVRLEYLGTENIGGAAYKLRVRRVPAPTAPRADEIEAGSPVTVWLSAATYLPIQIEYLEQSFTNRLAFMARIRKYSDYRSVQGILVPFHQEVWSEAQLMYALDITSVQFNVGLPATDFQLTSSQGGR